MPGTRYNLINRLTPVSRENPRAHQARRRSVWANAAIAAANEPDADQLELTTFQSLARAITLPTMDEQQPAT
jgi:phage terminase large subunit-like protein